MRRSEKIQQALLAAELGADIPTLDLHEEDPYSKEVAIHAVEDFIGKYGTQPKGIPEVLKIITGRGTGTLYRSVSEYCKKHPRILLVQGSDRPDQSGAVLFVVFK